MPHGDLRQQGLEVRWSPACVGSEGGVEVRWSLACVGTEERGRRGQR